MSLLQDQSSRRLRTWKEIAAYFGRDERTVKRWEARRGLPVHRAPGGGGVTVFALADELDRWMREGRADEDAAVTGIGIDPAHVDPAPPPPEPGPAAPLTRPRSPAGNAGRRWLIAFATCVLILLVGVGAAVAVRGTGVSAARRAAQALYSQGLYAWNTRTAAGLAEAQDDFTQAVVDDPSYAQAYAGLADVYNLSPEFGALPASEAFPRARAAAERALALNDRLAAAHRSLAFADFWWFRRIPQAEAHFRRAIALEPRSAQTHHWFSNMLSTLGRFGEGLQESDRAIALDPNSTAARADRGLLLLSAGRYEEAVRQLRAVAVAQPDFCPAHSYLIKAYTLRGDLHDAAAEWAALKHAKGGPAVDALAADAQAALDHGDERRLAAAQLRTAQRLHAQGLLSASVLARYAMRAGDRAAALADLQEAITRPDVDIVGFGSESAFASLRDDPSFKRILALSRAPLRE